MAGLVFAAAVALAGSAIGLVYRLFVSPLDVDGPERIFVVRAVETDGDVADVFAAPQYKALDDAGALAGFDAAGAIGYQHVDIETATGRHRSPVAFVSSDVFEVLGRPIRRGRGFRAWDFAEGAPSVAVLSEFYWRGKLNALPTVIGDHITVGGVDVTVVGIAPPGVIGTRLDLGPAAFLPMPLARTILPHRPGLWPAPQYAPTQEPIFVDWLTVMVRRGVGQTDLIAERELNGAVPKDNAPGLTNIDKLQLVPLLEAAVPMTSQLKLTGSAQLLLTVSIVLLVLGSATLALAALHDVEARREELVTRLALGATRLRVVAAMTMDVLVIGLGAVALAYPLSAAMMATATNLPLPGSVEMGFLGLAVSGRTALGIAAIGLVGAALAATVVTLAALSYTRDHTLSGMRLNSSRLIAPRLRGAVVALLASLAITLLGGAIFAFRAVSRTMAVDVGHRADGVLYASLDLRQRKYTETEAHEFLGSLTRHLLRNPVIKNAGIQYRAGGFVDTLHFDGQQQNYPGQFPVIAVDHFYFDVLRLRPVAGRSFVASDTVGQERTAIISASVADAIAGRNGLGSGSDVVGHRLLLGYTEFRPTTIVGVVPNWVQDPRDLTGRAIYLPASQHPTSTTRMAKGSAGLVAQPTLVLGVEDVDVAKRAVLRAIRDIDSQVSPVNLSSTQERLEAAYALQHFGSSVMSIFSAIAVVLGLVSLHVLVRSIATSKRREIAIRAALGANRLRIASWFVGEISKPMLSAVFFGAVGLWVWFSVMSAQVLGIVASDLGIVVTILGAISIWALGSAVASGVRAGYKSPADVLREE